MPTGRSWRLRRRDRFNPVRKSRLGRGAAERSFLEHPAALRALHALDLVRHALALAEHVHRRRLMAVSRADRNWAAHIVHGSCALGKYDARTEQKL
jgi:hypothetical protein